VEGQNILAAPRAKTVERAGQPRTVRASQDTSSLVYTSQRQTTGVGKLSLKKGTRVEKLHSQGRRMQSGLAVTTNGLALGLWDQKICAREAVAQDRPEPRNVTPIEEKESYRWRDSLKNSRPVRGRTQLVTVGDREADIYEFFALSAEIAAPVWLRANYARSLNNRSLYAEKDMVKLWKHLKQQPCAGSFTVEIPARPGTKHATPRAPRVALVELRFVAFKLNPPKRLSSPRPDLARYAIYVREKDPPADEQPLEWRLLSNLPINNLEQAYETVQWYCLRWRIERYPKVLKSGFHLEHCRRGAAQRLIRYVTVMSIVAGRLVMLTRIARTHPETPCTALLTDNLILRS